MNMTPAKVAIAKRKHPEWFPTRSSVPRLSLANDLELSSDIVAIIEPFLRKQVSNIVDWHDCKRKGADSDSFYSTILPLSERFPYKCTWYVCTVGQNTTVNASIVHKDSDDAASSAHRMFVSGHLRSDPQDDLGEVCSYADCVFAAAGRRMNVTVRQDNRPYCSERCRKLDQKSRGPPNNVS